MKLAITGESYQPGETRTRDLILGLIGTVYGFWLCYAAGSQMLLTSLLFVPGLLVFLWHQKNQHAERLLKGYEALIAVLLVIVALITLYMIATGHITLG